MQENASRALMRALLACAVLLLLPAAQAAHSAGFGADVEPAFQEFAAPDLPGAGNAGEPTIGIPWNTDDVFYQAYTNTYRIQFEGDEATWEDVTPPNSIINVDPMLHADPEAGRVWAGGLAGPCSIMAYTDDNGETWIPTGNMCSGAQFDHQSIGSGPFADLPAQNPVFPHATYYCAQLAFTACATSVDGGVTWGPFNEVLPPCGGLHGHIRVSRATGMAAVPHNNCGGQQGFAYTTTNGALWMSRTLPDAPGSQGGFDPSLQFGSGGALWYAQADKTGAHIALSHDEGLEWETLGAGMGDESTWLDVGAFHDPPIVHATFADVQVGDDDRAAFSFLGLTEKEDGYPDIHGCDDRQDELVWHYYIAITYDAGSTWTTTRMSEDPVQVGGIWDRGGGDPCRNLLDFNDMDIDSQGRIHVAFADGCIDECATDPSLGSSGSRTDHATLLRQSAGRGLFAEWDVQEPEPVPTTAVPDDREESTPAPAALVLLVLAGLAVALRRR